MASTTDFAAMVRALASHRVECIIVGGVGAVLQGAPVMTYDLDVVHARTPENIDRLLTALQGLDAYYREHEPRRLRPTAAYLGSPGHHLLMTAYGPLDVLGTVTGERGYDELLPHTRELALDEGLSVRVLDLKTLILLKEESGRDKDRAVLPILRRALELRDRPAQG